MEVLGSGIKNNREMVNTQASTQIKKLNIIELAMSIDDDILLAAIEEDILRRIQNAEKKPSVWDAVKPIRKNVSLEQMIEEQGTKSIGRDEFFALAEEVGLDDPIDELLADLTT